MSISDQTPSSTPPQLVHQISHGNSGQSGGRQVGWDDLAAEFYTTQVRTGPVSLCHKEPARSKKLPNGSFRFKDLLGARAGSLWRKIAGANNIMNLSTNESQVSLDLDQWEWRILPCWLRSQRGPGWLRTDRSQGDLKPPAVSSCKCCRRYHRRSQWSVFEKLKDKKYLSSSGGISPRVSSLREVKAEASLSGTIIERWLSWKISNFFRFERPFSFANITLACFSVSSASALLLYLKTSILSISFPRHFGETALRSQSNSGSCSFPSWTEVTGDLSVEWSFEIRKVLHRKIMFIGMIHKKVYIKDFAIWVRFLIIIVNIQIQLV